MKSQNTEHALVDNFLESLRQLLRNYPTLETSEYIDEIATHISESIAAMDPTDVDGLRKLLARVGTPKELANEFITFKRESVFANRQAVAKSRIARHLIVSLLALAVTVFVSGSIIWVDHYQPLMDTPGGPYSKVTLPNGNLAPATNGTGSDLATFTIWSMPKGASTVWVATYLTNKEDLAVKVVRVQEPNAGFAAFGPPILHVGNAANFSGASPFHPFVLQGHKSTEVFLKIPMHCIASSSGEVTEVSRLLVVTSFHGISHEVWINIVPFGIRFPAIC